MKNMWKGLIDSKPAPPKPTRPPLSPQAVRGLCCPEKGCGSCESIVMETRKEAGVLLRRRKCSRGHVFFTQEAVIRDREKGRKRINDVNYRLHLRKDSSE